MTNAQAKYLVSLCGGLDEAIMAAGLPKQFSGRNAKMAKLEGALGTAEASALIDSLRRPQAPAGTRDNLVSEGQEVDGYMIDRGEDN